MSILSALLLGIIQGVAEFLPISSSGHLSVLQNIFNLQTAEDGHLFFDVMLHMGTVVAILAAYWNDIKRIVWDSLGFLRVVRGLEPAGKEYVGARLLLLMFIGSLPLAVILLVNDYVEQLYYKTGFIAAAFALTGVMLYSADRMKPGRKNERTMTVKDAFIIGLCQAVGTLPGISRSGSTITAGIATGQNRGYAMRYSLLLSVPAVVGANLLSFVKALKSGVEWSYMPAYIVGTVAAMIVGYFCIVILRRILKNNSFGKFAYYMWGISLFTFIVSLF